MSKVTHNNACFEWMVEQSQSVGKFESPLEVPKFSSWCFAKQRVDVPVPRVRSFKKWARIGTFPLPQKVEDIKEIVQTFTWEICHHCTVEQTGDAFVTDVVKRTTEE